MDIDFQEILKRLENEFIPQLYIDIKNIDDRVLKENTVINWEHLFFKKDLKFSSLGIGRNLPAMENKVKRFPSSMNNRIFIKAYFLLKTNKIKYSLEFQEIEIKNDKERLFCLKRDTRCINLILF